MGSMWCRIVFGGLVRGGLRAVFGEGWSEGSFW